MSVAITGSKTDQDDVYDAGNLNVNHKNSYAHYFICTESGFKTDSAATTLSHEDNAALFQTENTKVKLKHAVISGTFDISLSDFAKLFVEENAPYSYKRY